MYSTFSIIYDSIAYAYLSAQLIQNRLYISIQRSYRGAHFVDQLSHIIL